MDTATPSHEQQVRDARRALATAKTRELIASHQRSAGQITKSCHRDAVAVRIDCQRRLNELAA